MNDLISKEEAINRIEQCIRTAEEPYQLTETDEIMNHAFEIAASCVYNLPAAEPLTEEDYIELRDRFGDYVAFIVKDMVTGKGERWKVKS